MNNVLEDGGLILQAPRLQTKQLLQCFSFNSFQLSGSPLIDLKSKYCGDKDIWWNNIAICDELGDEAPREQLFSLVGIR